MGMPNPPESPELRSHRIEYSNQRWKQLHALEKECAEIEIKYLLLTNSGGAVTVLSFMGASEKARASTGAIIALACFAVGIVLVGIFNIIRYYKVASLFREWRRESENYFEGKTDWKALTDDDNKRSYKNYSLHIVGNLSFVAFVVGAIFGMINLFK